MINIKELKINYLQRAEIIQKLNNVNKSDEMQL